MGLNSRAPFPKRPRLKSFDYIGPYAYFITILTKDRATRFKEAKLVDGLIHILTETAKSERFNLIAYCFMPDHLHLLVVGKDGKSDLKKFIGLFKQKSGYRYRENYQEDLWHVSYYDHILRKEETIENVIFYILENPVRKGIVSNLKEYPFSKSFCNSAL